MHIKYQVAILLSICAIYGCSRTKRELSVKALQVTIEHAVRDSIPLRMEFVGQTEGNISVVIQPRINGFLVAKHYRKGMPVKKGQLLYEIDPPEYQADMNAALASLSSAEAQLTQTQNDYNRAVPLAAINAISQSMLDQYKARYASAEANRDVARAKLNNAELKLGYTKIYAPVDGIIGQDDPAAGEYVGMGTKYPTLNTISNVDSIQVGLALPVARYLEVVKFIRDNEGRIDPAYANRRLLSDIRLELSDGSQYPWPGRYIYTDQSVGNAMGTLILRVIFPNPDRLLKAGEYAKIRANVGPVRDAVLVPQKAVSQSQGIDALWVMLADSTVEYRIVKLGDTYERFRVVAQGIEEGEAVLTSGQLKVKNGVKVTSVNDSL